MVQTFRLNPVRVALAMIAFAALVLSMLSVVSPVAAQGGNPSGNNGTVKIDGMPLDPGPGDNGQGDPDNEPHVGCVFNVDWYNFEANVESDVLFRVQPPTGGFQDLLSDTVMLDDDDASGANAEGLDATVQYDLSEALAAFEPHPNQGYHIKLTVNTEGSRGADVKHKVFWVEACAAPSSPPPSTPPGDGDGDGDGDNGDGDGDGDGGVAGSTGRPMPNTAGEFTVGGVSVTAVLAILLLVGSLAALVVPQVSRRNQR